MLREWVLVKLNVVKDLPRVLVRDSLRLLPETDGMIDGFAREHGFAVVVAATNLAFRELYERTVADPETRKILVIDRAPARRRASPSAMKAPPPFYPDLLAHTPEEARIDIDLRQFLRERTGDPGWPVEANDPRYARLILRHLEAVLRAHRNLRTAHDSRFTDHDFKTIVAFAALGVADSAFKRLDADDYWKIGLLGHEALEELGTLAPEVTQPIRDRLRQAPAPFCWFGDRDPETVIRAFYLAVILAQHLENWPLLLANIEPGLAPMTGIKDQVLWDSAPRVVSLDPGQAERDLNTVEQSLQRETLQFLLLEQMKLTEPAGFASVVEKEGYSTLLRSLSMLLALDNLCSARPDREAHRRLARVLFPEEDQGVPSFVDTRTSITWSQVKDAYRLAREVHLLRAELARFVKTLKVKPVAQLSFDFFREHWNEKRINRLEYYLSALDRLVQSGNLLPRHPDELPSVFAEAVDRIRQQIRAIANDVQYLLDEVNRSFQGLVGAQYPAWLAEEGAVHLTSQFVKRCLKPYWDPQHEKAVVMIFDGMRYDIWDELLRPMLMNHMELVTELPACALLPSETHVTRKAISAGTFPEAFDMRSAEDRLLKEALVREFGYPGEVETVAPEGVGVGETVRYRAGNLEVYIFELCDKGLHGIKVKNLPDGREVPVRPLSFIYEQNLKNIIDTEVMAIVRGLAPGTKVFVTADHGFGTVGREPLWFDERDLNEKTDCSYLNCLLRVPIVQANLPAKVRHNIIAFTPEQLRMPAAEIRTFQSGQVLRKEYAAIVFPRVGYSFKRKDAPYYPDAYSHGGISIQELIVPMAVLRVRAREEGMLALSAIIGRTELVEGEEADFRALLNRIVRATVGTDELRIEVEASYSLEPERFTLPQQVQYVPVDGTEIVYRFRPETAEATDEERRQGVMERTFTVTVSYRDGRRTVRKSQTRRFSVRLNPEQVVRRVPAHLGHILGLTPKSMR